MSILRPLLALCVVILGTAGTAGGEEPAAGAATPCPATFRDHGPTTMAFSCSCSAEATRSGKVFGADVYSDDSSICRAALHAGAVPPTGGPVTVYPVQPLGLYEGYPRHGVGSARAGNHTASFALAVLPADRLSHLPCPVDGTTLRGTTRPIHCWCSPTDVLAGDVWGTDLYADESKVCRAAIHAGVLTLNGGIIGLRAEAGEESYTGSVRHQVTSQNHGGAPGSIRFQPRTQTPDCWSSDCGASNH